MEKVYKILSLRDTINASVDEVWKALTDYKNLDKLITYYDHLVYRKIGKNKYSFTEHFDSPFGKFVQKGTEVIFPKKKIRYIVHEGPISGADVTINLKDLGNKTGIDHIVVHDLQYMEHGKNYIFSMLKNPHIADSVVNFVQNEPLCIDELIDFVKFESINTGSKSIMNFLVKPMIRRKLAKTMKVKNDKDSLNKFVWANRKGVTQIQKFLKSKTSAKIMKEFTKSPFASKALDWHLKHSPNAQNIATRWIRSTYMRYYIQNFVDSYWNDVRAAVRK